MNPIGKRFREEDTISLDCYNVDYERFRSYLQEASANVDPFVALTDKFMAMEGHWTCSILLETGAYVECQLAFDEFASSCFGTKREGEFRYIELFEYDENGVVSETALISIRISKDHEEGEWQSINSGRGVTGRQACSIAEEISRAMKIKTCYLTDSAKVLASDGRNWIYIRIPLQIIFGRGYYSPLFSIVNTAIPILSAVDSTEDLYYIQDVPKHQSELVWLQNLKVGFICDKIFKRGRAPHTEFSHLIKRYDPTWTFQTLLSELYKRKKEPVALADYEWIYFNLLDASKLPDGSKFRERFIWIIDRLFFNMLMSANFH